MVPEEGLFNMDLSTLTSDDDMDVTEINAVDTEGNPVIPEPKPIIEEPKKVEEPKKPEEIEINNAEIVKEPDNQTSSKPIVAFTKYLQEQGIVPNLDIAEFEKSENPLEALTKAIDNEIKYANSRFINAFPKELIDIAEAISKGVPYDHLKDSKMRELSYNNISEDSLDENVNLQKRLVNDLLEIKGFKEEKITDLINTYEDTGKLKVEASEALDELKNYMKIHQEKVKQEYQRQQKILETRNKETIDLIKKTVDSSEEIIPGLKLSKVSKDTLFDNMTKIVGMDKNTNQPINYLMKLRSENPIKFDMSVTYLAGITNGFKDFSKMITSGKTQSVKELEKMLSSDRDFSKGNSFGKNIAGEEDNSESLLSSLKTMFSK